MLSLSTTRGLVVKEYEFDEQRRTQEESAGYWVSRPGDVVLNPMWLFKGAVAPSLLLGEGIVSPAYVVLRPNQAHDARFISYQLQSAPLLQWYAAEARGETTYDRAVKWEALGALAIPAPPLREQRRIADFLDRELDRIERLRAHLVTAHEKAAALASSWRSATVASLWDEHPQRRVGWDFSLLGGFAFQSERFVFDSSEGVALLRGINVGAGKVRWDDTVYWPFALADEVRAYMLREGDIVVGLNRPWIAGGLRVAEISRDDLPAFLLQRVACIRPRAGAKLTRSYLRLLMETDRFKHDVGDASAVTFPMLEPKRLAAWRVPAPPPDVQVRVVREAQHVARGVEALQASVESLSERLDEYRLAVLTEVVTGTRDVARTSDQEADERAHAALEGASA
jgi:type I restriction enzyme, S subunit